MARLMKIAELAPSEITVGARLRPISEIKVAALIGSLEELGVMMHPIQLVKHKGLDAHAGGFELVAGMHRLEAARRLKWSAVPVRVWADVTRDWTEVMELDENLSDPGMSALDTAVFLAKRKALYEAKYPETRRGAKGRMAANGDQTEQSSVWSFARVVSEMRGITERQIRKTIRAGELLSPAEVHALRKVAAQVSLSDLVELSKIPDAGRRGNIVTNLALGRIKTVKEGQRAWKANGAAPLSAQDRIYVRLAQAWSNASKRDRRIFVEEHRAELRTLLAETSE